MPFVETQEYKAIKEAFVKDKDFKVGAVAGSGKTTTCVQLANLTEKKALMLVFNKANQLDAQRKLPSNVQCRTTHSIAWGAYIEGESQCLGKVYEYKLKRPKGQYKNMAGTAAEIAKYYDIEGEKGLGANKIAFFAKLAVKNFESSADREVSLKHLPEYEILKVVKRSEKKELQELKPKYIRDTVLPIAKKLSKDRLNPKSPVLCSHDTYLKRFQLSKPKLKFDIIFLDEAQDTTDVVLDIVDMQGAQKIYVGDKNQAIYGWRGAVNAMAKVNVPSLPLTKSWRYGQAVADVATKILSNGVIVQGNDSIDSKIALVDTSKPYTHLFRTGAALLEEACTLAERGVEVLIEIDTRDFLNRLNSALALKNGEMQKVKHEEVKIHESWKEYVDESEGNGEDARIVGIINRGQAGAIIGFLCGYEAPHNPEVTLTTAHRSKGREWDQVLLGEDFPSTTCKYSGKEVQLPQEEINLLYVAATRAIKVLEINETVADLLGEFE